nr:MAG TPA: hypothetical protein [Caudoviricetes sp.]
MISISISYSNKYNYNKHIKNPPTGLKFSVGGFSVLTS